MGVSGEGGGEGRLCYGAGGGAGAPFRVGGGSVYCQGGLFMGGALYLGGALSWGDLC